MDPRRPALMFTFSVRGTRRTLNVNRTRHRYFFCGAVNFGKHTTLSCG